LSFVEAGKSQFPQAKEDAAAGLLDSADALDAATDPAAITDDASAVEALGLAPRLVEGHPRNLKVTLPSDIRIAEMYLAADASI
ncbi:MAG: 2-C-methyl-D-erythritol 4-phosphate cytidylyltransferase, partial [Massilia sp.]